MTILNDFAMKYLIHTILFFLLGVSGGFAQPGATVVGQLKTTADQPVEFATVALFAGKDSSLVKGTLSDSAGRFRLEKIPAGQYYLKASSVGFRDLKTPTFVLTDQNGSKDLGTLHLAAAEQTLEGVTVTAKKPLIEQRIDRTVLNIENSILAEGNTALELLERAPGIKVDDEGTISLKGRPGVTVMINGKLTYLSQRELTTLLRGTASGAVAKIEIIANPSAKYDAAGNAGIINIVLKKNDKMGINGSAYVNAARSRANRYGGGLNLNYRSGRMNVYGSYDRAFRGEVEYLSFIRRFRDASGNPDQTSYQRSATSEPLYTNNYKLGADFFPNPRNTFGVLVNGNFGKYINDNTTHNQLIVQSGELLSSPVTYNDNLDRWNSTAYNLNYIHRFGREGQELSADLDYSLNDNRSNLKMDTRYPSLETAGPETRSVRKGRVPSLTNVYVGKIDYVHPFGTKAKLETGWKSSYVDVDNNLKYDTLRNNQWIPDPSWSNHFNYRETIHAGYINFSKEFGKVSLQVGLRGENTQTFGHQVTTDSVVKRTYFQLFPSVFATRTFNEAHSAQVSYSRRIQRPDYSDLNPFRFFRDPFLYYEGNPFLRPERTHSVELGHSYKGKLITAINYSYTADVMNWMVGQVDSLNTTFQSPQNLKSLINYGLSLTASLQPTRWWTTNTFGNVFHSEYRGDHKGGDLNNGMVSFTFNTQNTFQLGNGFSAELSAWYESKSVYGVFVTKSLYAVSVGGQKQILDKKGTVKLVVNDVFQTRQWRQTARYENLDLSSHIRFDSRMVTLSFSYRFGRDITPVRNRKSGSEDIQNRVKGGG